MCIISMYLSVQHECISSHDEFGKFHSCPFVQYNCHHRSPRRFVNALNFDFICTSLSSSYRISFPAECISSATSHRIRISPSVRQRHSAISVYQGLAMRCARFNRLPSRQQRQAAIDRQCHILPVLSDTSVHVNCKYRNCRHVR